MSPPITPTPAIPQPTTAIASGNPASGPGSCPPGPLRLITGDSFTPGFLPRGFKPRVGDPRRLDDPTGVAYVPDSVPGGPQPPSLTISRLYLRQLGSAHPPAPENSFAMADHPITVNGHPRRLTTFGSASPDYTVEWQVSDVVALTIHSDKVPLSEVMATARGLVYQPGRAFALSNADLHPFLSRAEVLARLRAMVNGTINHVAAREMFMGDLLDADRAAAGLGDGPNSRTPTLSVWIAWATGEDLSVAGGGSSAPPAPGETAPTRPRYNYAFIDIPQQPDTGCGYGLGPGELPAVFARLPDRAPDTRASHWTVLRPTRRDAV